MVLKNVFRGDIIKCCGYNGGKILSYNLPSGDVRHRYGKFDQVVGRNVVLINVGEDAYIDLNELSSHFGTSSSISFLPTVATGEDSYYVDKDSLVEYEYSYVSEDEMYDDTEINNGVRLSKKQLLNFF